MAVCCPEASSVRRRKRQQGEGSRESKRDGQRKARPGAARKTPQVSPDCASLSGWRAGRRPVFSRGNTGTERTMVAPPGAPSPSLWRGGEERQRRRAYPGPRQIIRVMTHGSLKIEYERLAAERTRTPHPSASWPGSSRPSTSYVIADGHDVFTAFQQDRRGCPRQARA
jgi:hypothetical protein